MKATHTTARPTHATRRDAGTRRHRSARRGVVTAPRRGLSILAAVMAAALMLTVPAAAAPAGPDLAEDLTTIPDLDIELDIPDELIPDPDPDPEPSAALGVIERCEPEPGIEYDLSPSNGPVRPWTGSIEWQNLTTGEGGSAGGPLGSIDTGEGTVEVKGTVVYPPYALPGGKAVLPALVLTADPEVVTVDCPGDEPEDDPEDEPEDEPEDDPEDEPEDPDVRSGTPTFTG